MRLENLPLPDPIMRLASNLAGVFMHTDNVTALRYGSALLRNTREVFRTRNLRPVDEAMAGKQARFYVDGTEIQLDGAEFSGAREMYCRGVYFSHPSVRLIPNSTVVDLGANTGLFTLVAAMRSCRVVAVEAQRGFLHEIRHRLARLPLTSRVDLECSLIGGSKGVFANAAALAEASHFEADQNAPTMSMDELCEKYQLDRIDFLKCDIEGSEFGLFDRGTAWLARVQQLAMEVHPAFGDPEEIVSALTHAGMTAECFDDLLRPSRRPDARGGYLFAWRDSGQPRV